MSAAALVSFRAPVLPWSVSADDELRFRRIAQRVLVSAALLCIALPWLPVSQPDRAPPQPLPARLAKLI
ncbi:MAG: energy transducer TonB, partial [Burkholderiales bacterium]|nr:energy transducer TonB [Burkholderiales bacterium]